MKSTTTGVMTDDQIAALKLRNEEKAAAAIEAMGVKYACHPTNMLKRDPLNANFTPRIAKPVQGVLQLRRQKGGA